MGPDRLDHPTAGLDHAASQAAAAAPAPGRLTMVGRQLDYWVTVYRRTWRGSVFTSFLMPLFYVFAMGVLLGGFIDDGSADLQGAPSYLAFIAPGLVAAHAMTIATSEVMWPVYGAVKWSKTYLGMVATPLSVGDIVAAHFAFVLFRVATTCGVFLAVLAPFGVFASVGGVLLAFLVQLLLGMAFATPLYALSAGLKTTTAFAVIYRVGLVPLFLFSGAFFPITNLPPLMQWLAVATPLWHGVDLTRMLTLGDLDATAALVHVAYLGVMLALGWWWAVRRLTRTLVH
jgi:lipooligosaccharide transport system permease protein